MRYEYGCNQDPAHPRVEVIHSMTVDPEMRCSMCNSPMHRVPQIIRWYRNPGQLLISKMSDRLDEIKKRKLRKHA